MHRFRGLVFTLLLITIANLTGAPRPIDGVSAQVDDELDALDDAVLPIPEKERFSIKDWYIVALTNDGPDPGVLATDLARDHGFLISHVYRFGFRGFAAKIPPEAVEGLRHHPHIASITPDQEMQLAAQEIPAGVHRIEAAPAFKNATANIDGVHEVLPVDVAVLDSGIDRDHPDLNYAGGISLSGPPAENGIDCTAGSGPGTDQLTHGTHVAGIIGAKDNDRGVVGVAPGVRLWSVKITEGSSTNSRIVICGVNYVTAFANRFEVANISLYGFRENADDGNCGYTQVDLLH